MYRCCKRLAFVLMLALLCVIVTPGVDDLASVPEVEAKTGSSAGGGSFRSRSSDSSSSSSSSSASRRSSSSSSSYQSSSSSSSSSSHSTPSHMYGGGHDPFDDHHNHDDHDGGGAGGEIIVGLLELLGFKGVFILLVLIGMGWLLYHFVSRPPASSGFDDDYDLDDFVTAQPFTAPVKVARAKAVMLEVAFEDPERVVQHQLEGLARAADLSTPGGLRAFLGEVLVLTRRQMNNAEQGRLRTEQGGMDAVEGTYRGWLTSARTKFDRDILRIHGETMRGAPTRNVKTASALVDEDGDFESHQYMVMSLAVAWEGGPGLPTPVRSVQELIACLDVLDQISTTQLMVMEVVWSPSAESDAMGKSDMLTSYPELSML